MIPNSSSPTPFDAGTTGTLQTFAPAEVRWALKMLWLSLAISMVMPLTLLYGVYFRPTPQASASAYLLPVLHLPLVWGIFCAFLYRQIASGKNWARLMQFVITLAFLAYEIAYLPAPTGNYVIKVALVHGLDWTAMYLLFITSGRQWFRKASEREES
jgi:hypothetical protein